MRRMRLRLLYALVLMMGAGGGGSVHAQARWLRAESTNFIVHTDMDDEAARRYAAQLETFDHVLRARHGVAVDEPVRRKLPIYLLRRDADMRRIKPGVDRGLRGFFTSTIEDTYAVAIAMAEDRNDPVLQHEYVHHFMLQRYPAGYPGWLVEGYAEYFMTFQETPKFLEVGRANANRAAWLLRGPWLPFEIVLKARPSDLRTGEAMAMYYAQAWGLTHWFLSDPGRARQLDAYLQAVARGGDPVKAVTEATGLSPDQLGRTVRTYLNNGSRCVASTWRGGQSRPSPSPPCPLRPLTCCC